jgi:hypothetical protein
LQAKYGYILKALKESEWVVGGPRRNEVTFLIICVQSLVPARFFADAMRARFPPEFLPTSHDLRAMSQFGGLYGLQPGQ